jgi:hypothetical protein
VSIKILRDSLETSGYRGIAVTLALKMLARKDWIELTVESDHWNHDEYPVARLTDEGWRWLEANQDKLTLTIEPPDDTPIPSNPTSGDDIPF